MVLGRTFPNFAKFGIKARNESRSSNLCFFYLFEKGYEFLEVNGIQIHYSLEGDENNPTLVLINMASHNLTSWEIVIDDFLSEFQILRFDGRGTGLSSFGKDEGILMEPPPSEPVPKGIMPEANAADVPPEDPPGE